MLIIANSLGIDVYGLKNKNTTDVAAVKWWFYLAQNTEYWVGDVHTLLLGAGSFVALMVAGLITSATGPLGWFYV